MSKLDFVLHEDSNKLYPKYDSSGSSKVCGIDFNIPSTTCRISWRGHNIPAKWSTIRAECDGIIDYINITSGILNFILKSRWVIIKWKCIPVGHAFFIHWIHGRAVWFHSLLLHLHEAVAGAIIPMKDNCKPCCYQEYYCILIHCMGKSSHTIDQKYCSEMASWWEPLAKSISHVHSRIQWIFHTYQEVDHSLVHKLLDPVVADYHRLAHEGNRSHWCSNYCWCWGQYCLLQEWEKWTGHQTHAAIFVGLKLQLHWTAEIIVVSCSTTGIATPVVPCSSSTS